MSASLPVVARGAGRTILCIHGSATDRGAFALLLGPLSQGYRVVAYDRRGSLEAPLAPGERPTTADHAGDAAALLAAGGGGPALVVGSSYGAVVALELALRAPSQVAGLVLCEPPLSPRPEVAAAPIGLGCALEQLAARHGGAAAAELFLRAVLGDGAFERLPAPIRARTLRSWPQIQADARALAAWSLDRARLAWLAAPVLLVGGDRSPPRFGDALDALALVLPDAAQVTLVGAGHAMQIDQPQAFERAVREMAARVLR
jgi:pimeloyl-ACP methyl ester carboxylesterase